MVEMANIREQCSWVHERTPETTEKAIELTRTVSYTHLRAHETVLDLVCRLLLEKNKRIYLFPHLMHPHSTLLQVIHSLALISPTLLLISDPNIPS